MLCTALSGLACTKHDQRYQRSGVIFVCTGISFSNDKLLQTRVFSYTDTQRYRLGVNYQMLPVNQPKCPFHNNHFDGQMNFMHKNEEVRTLGFVRTVVPCSALTSSYTL